MDTRTTLTLWSLRPAGEHAALRRVAQGAGFALRVLPLQRLVARREGGRLAAALASPIRLYTSPAAVRFAAAQAGGDLCREGVDLGVGSGTAAALRRAGARDVRSPGRMDSDGVLALEALQSVEGRRIGVVTAPGGRGLLLPALRQRGADVRLAEVYARAPLHGGARRLAALAADRGAVLVVSSAETLGLLEARALIAAAPRARDVRARPIIVSSPRLGDLATRAGFLDVRIAEGPTPEALVAAASRAWPLQS